MTLGRMGGESAIQDGQVLITVGEKIYFGGRETQHCGGVLYPDPSLDLLLPFK